MKLTRTQPGLMPSQPRAISRSNSCDVVEVDAEQAVAVRPGARAAAARLDAEQVVEQRDDEVVVQVPLGRGATTNDTIDSRSASWLPRISMFGLAPPRSMARRMNDSSRSRIASAADRLLELEDEPRADRLEDRRRAALLAMLGVGEVAVLLGVDVGDRAAAGHRGHAVREQLALRTTSTPGVPGPPMNLCGERKIASL